MSSRPPAVGFLRLLDEQQKVAEGPRSLQITIEAMMHQLELLKSDQPLFADILAQLGGVRAQVAEMPVYPDTITEKPAYARAADPDRPERPALREAIREMSSPESTEVRLPDSEHQAYMHKAVEDFQRLAPASGEPGKPMRTLTAVTDLGQVVRDRRKSMGLTQQQFADITGVGRRFISELESGKPTLEFGRVLKVCQNVGIELMAAMR